jgi:hypothetical protein
MDILMKPILRLLALLSAFFRPQVDGDGAGDSADGGAGDSAGAGDDASDAGGEDQLDLDLNADDGNAEDAGGKKADLASGEDLEAERRARKAEQERAERAERELAEIRTRAARPAADDETAREDAELQNPATDALRKWQIQANRTLRQNTSASQLALAQAQDIRDQTSFAAICISDPVAKKYQTRVEQELAKARHAGQNPTREGLYTFMLGRDMREGKFKRKAAPAAGDAKQAVNRGKLPGARSDVQAKGASMSNRDRLAKKLDGVQI